MLLPLCSCSMPCTSHFINHWALPRTPFINFPALPCAPLDADTTKEAILSGKWNVVRVNFAK